MKLLVQPGEGVDPLVKAIHAARKTIEIVVFRFDRKEVERALSNAVNRGIAVRALIAHTNRAGEESLRQLEMRLLEAGVVVARTDNDLVRYHSKFMIVDRRDLYVLAFNLTYADIERSRSFGLVTRSASVVKEALQLFEADVQRRPYEASNNQLVVSPSNARKELAKFIRGAKHELLIYDPKITDPSMIAVLEARARAGVDVRIIGRTGRQLAGVDVRRLAQLRLHTRTMVRDGKSAFIGSQSLREAELDSRREVGIIIHDSGLVGRLHKTFQSDWTASDPQKRLEEETSTHPAERVARKVAKLVAKELPPVAPVLDGAVKEVVGENAAVDVNSKEVQDLVKDAIKEAVREVVKDVVEEAVEVQAERRTA
jgi:phosphatidylserine/phosphatidylglycerophosphate/cardiolipin synthase-like enzyme